MAEALFRYICTQKSIYNVYYTFLCLYMAAMVSGGRKKIIFLAKYSMETEQFSYQYITMKMAAEDSTKMGC